MDDTQTERMPPTIAVVDLSWLMSTVEAESGNARPQLHESSESIDGDNCDDRDRESSDDEDKELTCGSWIHQTMTTTEISSGADAMSNIHIWGTVSR